MRTIEIVNRLLGNFAGNIIPAELYGTNTKAVIVLDTVGDYHEVKRVLNNSPRSLENHEVVGALSPNGNDFRIVVEKVKPYYQKFEKDIWCKGDCGTEDADFWDDGNGQVYKDRNGNEYSCDKHHNTCSECNLIIQIG